MTKSQISRILRESIITPSEHKILCDVTDDRYYAMKGLECAVFAIENNHCDDKSDEEKDHMYQEAITFLAMARAKLEDAQKNKA